MTLDLWPIVGRGRLVQTFRPGESATREGPFRTLRHHGWTTAGVSVVTRDARRASGRLTIFSVLNVEAARRARDGDGRAAVALCRAAARVERGSSFARLRALLSGREVAEVSAAIAGEVSEHEWPELHGTLRDVARATRDARPARRTRRAPLEIVTGAVTEARGDLLVLAGETGEATYVPRWLARSAHREQVGDLLALVTDKLDDDQMVVRAVPAIELDTSPARFTPFGPDAAVLQVSDTDARTLARRPAPLTIRVPVTIGR